MDHILSFVFGELFATVIGLIFFYTGRNTRYQDQNIPPPPVILPSIKPFLKTNRFVPPPMPVSPTERKVTVDPRIIGPLDEIETGMGLPEEELD